MSQEVAVNDAAQILRKSRRTVERMVKRGQLRSRKAGRRRLVLLPEGLAPAPRSPDLPGTTTELQYLRDQLAEVRSDRDFLRHVVDCLLSSQS